MCTCVFASAGLSLVVGLVLYISSINDEVMNRPREPEQFFHYHYGWSFAFAASSFLLKEVILAQSMQKTHTCTYSYIRSHSCMKTWDCCITQKHGRRIQKEAFCACTFIFSAHTAAEHAELFMVTQTCTAHQHTHTHPHTRTPTHTQTQMIWNLAWMLTQHILDKHTCSSK